MMKLKKGFQIAYLIVGALVVCEYIFVQGMFTWLIAVGAACVMGVANILLTAKDREWRTALLYLLCTLALCMGYLTMPGY